MKIKKIEDDKEKSNVYIVTLIPNWFEKLLGDKETEIKYKDTGDTYSFGGGRVYIDQLGKQLGNHNYIGDALDNWIRRW